MVQPEADGAGHIFDLLVLLQPDYADGGGLRDFSHVGRARFGERDVGGVFERLDEMRLEEGENFSVAFAEGAPVTLQAYGNGAPVFFFHVHAELFFNAQRMEVFLVKPRVAQLAPADEVGDPGGSGAPLTSQVLVFHERVFMEECFKGGSPCFQFGRSVMDDEGLLLPKIEQVVGGTIGCDQLAQQLDHPMRKRFGVGMGVEFAQGRGEGGDIGLVEVHEGSFDCCGLIFKRDGPRKCEVAASKIVGDPENRRWCWQQ